MAIRMDFRQICLGNERVVNHVVCDTTSGLQCPFPSLKYKFKLGVDD